MNDPLRPVRLVTTGLTVVDTTTYWTPFGQGVILGLVQVGGFGIMLLATLLASIVSGKVACRRWPVGTRSGGPACPLRYPASMRISLLLGQPH